MTEQTMRIAVVGERAAAASALRLAEDVGRLIATRKAILICGGLGGVMEAASRGCRLAGGIAVGILPGNDARSANPYISIPIVTGMEEGRNIVIVRSADAVIAIGGSYGTLSEIALALRLGIPVVGMDTWTFFRERENLEPLVRSADPEEAVHRALALAAARREAAPRPSS